MTGISEDQALCRFIVFILMKLHAFSISVVCNSDVKSSRKHAKTVGGSKVLYIKSHPHYGTEKYPGDLDCWATLKAPARGYHQRLRIEVVEGQISGDSYFELGSERFSNIRNIGISRAFQIMPGQEDRKVFTIHFHAGGSQDTGFLIKLTGGV